MFCDDASRRAARVPTRRKRKLDRRAATELAGPSASSATDESLTVNWLGFKSPRLTFS
jgi:hypothetical protein